MKSSTLFTLCALLTAAGAMSLPAQPAGDLITDWNSAISTYVEARPIREISPAVETCAFALTHLAMFDAVSAVLNTGGAGASPRLESAEAAAAQAAHDVLIAIWPDGTELFDAQLAAYVSTRTATGSHTRGREIGAQTAQHWIAQRVWEGWIGASGGRTAKLGHAQPPWRNVAPFVLKRRNQLRAPSPGSPQAYLAAKRFNKSQAVVSLLKEDRAHEWSSTATYWAERPVRRWNRIARLLAARAPHDLLERARLFASLNAALADACVAAHESQQFYASSQPMLQSDETAYEATGGREIPRTFKIQLPPVPNHPSVWAAMSGAAAVVLAWYFAGDEQSFTLVATSATADGATTQSSRTFVRISDAAKEFAVAGLLAGLDFRQACVVGYDQGAKVGRYVVKHAHFAAHR